jgi:hypothetical protein
MEQALIRNALRKGKHPALEVPYAHTIDIGHGTYWPEGQWEYIDAVIEQQGMFTCLELKQERMHEEVTMAVGPIIEKIVVKTFPDKSPEELGQFLVHDYAFGNIMAGYYLRRDEDELAEEALPDSERREMR